jgi:2-phosphoglycolate phosphatase
MNQIFTHPVQAVLFDLDGTLLDSAPDLGYAGNQLRVERGMEPLPQSLYRPFVGTGARGMVRIALGTTPDDSDFEAVKEEFFLAYERCMGKHSVLFEGVGPLLERLDARSMPWAIVTNKSERFTLPIIRNSKVLGRAATVVCGDTTSHSKPHPMPLIEAAKRIGAAQHSCVYVGDDERDMIAARSAQMGAVAAAYGYLGDAESVEAWKPDAVINSPCELTRLLVLD